MSARGYGALRRQGGNPSCKHKGDPLLAQHRLQPKTLSQRKTLCGGRLQGLPARSPPLLLQLLLQLKPSWQPYYNSTKSAVAQSVVCAPGRRRRRRPLEAARPGLPGLRARCTSSSCGTTKPCARARVERRPACGPCLRITLRELFIATQNSISAFRARNRLIPRARRGHGRHRHQTALSRGRGAQDPANTITRDATAT